MIERAEARLQASIMTMSSMRWSLTGGHVGWIKKTSQPRIDSCIDQAAAAEVMPSDADLGACFQHAFALSYKCKC